MPAETARSEHAPGYAPCRLEPLRPHHARALSRLDLGIEPVPWSSGSYVVTRLGAVVGLVTLSRRDDTTTVTVAVDGVRRGRGVGTTALLLADEIARSDGARRLTARVPMRDVAAIATLRRAGYRLVGTVRGRTPHLLYEKPLGPLVQAA